MSFLYTKITTKQRGETMIYKPKFMTPSTDTDNCLYDDGENTSFSCVIDGNEAIYGYRIRIYKLSDNSSILDTDRVTLDKPFYPVDSKNRSNVFTVGGVTGVNRTIYVHVTKLDEQAINRNNSGDIMISGKFCYIVKNGNMIGLNSTARDYESITMEHYKNNNLYITESITGTSIPFSIDAYYWIISLYNYADIQKGREPTNEYPVTVTSDEAVFFANQVPTLKIKYSVNDEDYTEPPDGNISIALNKCYFSGDYSQAQGVSLKKYGWRITDKSNGQILSDTVSKNQIYGAEGNIRLCYDGFLNDNEYSIYLEIEDQNGGKQSASCDLSVQYSTETITNDFNVSVLKQESAIILDWSKARVAMGEASGDISYRSNYPIVDNSGAVSVNSIDIPKGSSVSFSYGASRELDISENSYIALSTQLMKPANTTLFFAEGEDGNGNIIKRVLRFSVDEDPRTGDSKKGVFIYELTDGDDGIYTAAYSVQHKICSTVHFVFVMSPVLDKSASEKHIKLSTTESVAIGGLYPESNLYPSENIQPYFGQWNKLKSGGVAE